MIRKIILISLLVFLLAMSAATSLALWGISQGLLETPFPLDLSPWGRWSHSSRTDQYYEDTETFSLEGIDQITLEKHWGNLEILPTEDPMGTIFLAGQVPSDHGLQTTIRSDGNQLEIIVESTKQTWGSGDLDITLLLPRHQYDLLVVDSALGNLYIENIEASQIRIDTAMGNLTLNGDFQELDIKHRMGNLVISGSFHKLWSQGAMGNSDVTVSDFRELEIRQSLGNVTLEIPLGLSQKCFTAEAGMGNVNIPNHLQGDAPSCTGFLSTNMGNITVKEVDFNG